MTVKEILDLLGHRITAPIATGAQGAILTLNADGSASWGGESRTVDGEALVIGGKEYGVRTGSSGASGYLTIASNAVYLDKKQVSPYLGVNEITAIYGGGTLIFSSESGYYQVYYNGYKNGIQWEADKLPRPQYTSYAGTSFDYATTSSGYILQYISTSGGEWSFNTHAITKTTVTVPQRASKLHVYARGENTNSIELKFGLLPSNAPNSYSTSNGGQLSSAFTINSTTWQDCQMTLNSGIKGAANLKVIVNARGIGGTNRRMRTAWIWFD